MLQYNSADEKPCLTTLQSCRAESRATYDGQVRQDLFYSRVVISSFIYDRSERREKLHNVNKFNCTLTVAAKEIFYLILKSPTERTHRKRWKEKKRKERKNSIKYYMMVRILVKRCTYLKQTMLITKENTEEK